MYNSVYNSSRSISRIPSILHPETDGVPVEANKFKRKQFADSVPSQKNNGGRGEGGNEDLRKTND